MTIAAVESATDKSVETLEDEEKSLDEVESSEENGEAMEVEHAAQRQEEEEEEEEDKEKAAQKEEEKTSSPIKVHFSEQVCLKKIIKLKHLSSSRHESFKSLSCPGGRNQNGRKGIFGGK